MKERKSFVCGGFGHIACNCRNMESRRKEESILMVSNKFEVLKSRVINVGEDSGREIRKDRKMILRKKRLKEKPVDVLKIGADSSLTSIDSSRKEKEEKLLREIIVKIGLK